MASDSIAQRDESRTLLAALRNSNAYMHISTSISRNRIHERRRHEPLASGRRHGERLVPSPSRETAVISRRINELDRRSAESNATADPMAHNRRRHDH